MSERISLDSPAFGLATAGFGPYARARSVIFLLFSGVFFGGVFALPATATNPLDAQGYIENWPGNILPEYNSAPLPFPVPIPPLSQDISQAIASIMPCTQIHDGVSAQLGSKLSKWDSCSVPTNFELRGKMLAANELGLKIIFTNISFSFDVSGALGDNPTIKVTANMELDAVIDFANSINGCIPNTDPSFNTSPANVSSAQVGFSGASVTSSNALVSILNAVSDALGSSILGQLSAVINSQSLNETSLLNAQVDKQNPQIHTAACTLANLIKTTNDFGPPDPNANSFFLLVVTIDAAQNLVIDFERNGRAALTPNNCFLSSLSYGTVEAMCYSYDMSGNVIFDAVDPMFLQRWSPDTGSRQACRLPLTCGAWVVADNGVSNSWDNPPVRSSVPFFQDMWFQTQPSPPSAATYEVCGEDLWGGGCGPPLFINIDLTVQPAVSPGSTPVCGPGSIPYRRCMAVALGPTSRVGIPQGPQRNTGTPP
jgi:hypothetical protein